jgi:hypothetical protein
MLKDELWWAYEIFHSLIVLQVIEHERRVYEREYLSAHLSEQR